jgi:hypothetical protein
MPSYVAPLNADQLLHTAQSEHLYGALINQLQKDFNLANQHLTLPQNSSPQQVKDLIHESVFLLISNRFTDYLNLLYIIDVPENEVRLLDGTDMVRLSEQVTFLILKRSWQKVWFKHNYNA